MYFFRWAEEDNIEALFTPWSAVHVLSGMAAKDLGIPFWWFEGLHFMYEAKDYKEEIGSLTNSIGDQISGTVGHYLGYKTTNKTFVWLYVLGWGGAVFLGNSIG